MEPGRDLLGWGMGMVWRWGWEWYWVFHRTSCTSMCPLNKYLFQRPVAAVAEGGGFIFATHFVCGALYQTENLKNK